jgi:arylsulfatase A-like enzyme
MKFFMFIHHYICHSPYESPYFLEKVDEPSFAEERRALYDGDIRDADDRFGHLMETLEELDLLSNSIIVVVSNHGQDLCDHLFAEEMIPPIKSTSPGFSFVAHGFSVYDEVIRVPVIFYIPKFQPPQRVINNQIRLIDVMPTILDYLKISFDGPIQGESLLPLLATGERENDPSAISEFTMAGTEQKSVRMNGYKYIYAENPEKRKGNFTFPDIPRQALFDLKRDPQERVNIIAQNPELAEEYHRMLEEVLKESGAINKELQDKVAPGGEEPVDLPEEVANALKALGYMQ